MATACYVRARHGFEALAFKRLVPPQRLYLNAPILVTLGVTHTKGDAYMPPPLSNASVSFFFEYQSFTSIKSNPYFSSWGSPMVFGGFQKKSVELALAREAPLTLRRCLLAVVSLRAFAGIVPCAPSVSANLLLLLLRTLRTPLPDTWGADGILAN